MNYICRFAMSVIWELNKNYEVIGVWYGRTVIRSRYKLFYEVFRVSNMALLSMWI